MTLQQQISSDLTTAMKNREALRLETLRSIKTAFTNELVATSRTPQDELNDEDAIKVVKRLHKQRLEAAAQFQTASRTDLYQKEVDEAAIIETYLPEQISDAELETLVNQVLIDNDITAKSQTGIAIGKVMKEVGDRVDGKRVQQLIAQKLA